MTEVVVSDMDLGLEEDTITTYWLSYDRFIGFLIYSQTVNNYLQLYLYIAQKSKHWEKTLKFTVPPEVPKSFT
jgi:hypothetical protein